MKSTIASSRGNSPLYRPPSWADVKAARFRVWLSCLVVLSVAAIQPIGADKPASRPAPRPEEKKPANIRPLRSSATPSIVVETVYPGANAQVVADTVAAPIEQ